MKPCISFAAPATGLWLLTVVGALPVRAQSPSPAPSPTPSPLASIEDALGAEREAARQKAQDAAASARYAADNFDASHRYLLEQARQQLLRGEDEPALNTLSQIRAAATSDGLRKACDALAEQLRKTRAERETALETEADAVLKHAGEEVLRAREPRDLDATLHELNRVAGTRLRHSSSDDNVGRVLARLQSATSFVNRWQDYLFSLRRGDETVSANILRGLTDSNGSYSQFPIVPRSEILARVPATRGLDGSSISARIRPAAELNAAVAVILDATHTLDDVPEALRKLGDLRKETAMDATSDLSAALSGLQALQKARLEIQSGLAASIDLLAMRGESGLHPAVDGKLIPLRAELVNFALPRLLDAPDEKPAAGEGSNAFLRRLIEGARRRADWPTVLRGLEISRTLAIAQSTSSVDELREREAFRGFLSGLNLETAGQYEQASAAFLSALRSGAPNLPASLIGDHVDAIQKAHPKEFAAAKEHALNPPAQAAPGGPHGGFDPRTGQFRPPGMPEQPSPAPQNQ